MIFLTFSFFLPFLLLLNQIFTVSSYTVNTFEIRDLEDETDFFKQEASAWTVTNQISTEPTSQCAGTWLLGGIGIIDSSGSFSRTYSSLPPHGMIYYSLSIWLLDLGFFGDLFSIYMDNSLLGLWTSVPFLLDSRGEDVCGGSQNDYPAITITGKALHSDTSVKISIKSTLLGNPSFGIRDLRLQFKDAGFFDISSRCYFVDAPSSCLCSTGYYGSLFTCQPCDLSCQSCLGSAPDECASCPPGRSSDGAGGCFACDSSCDQCTGPGDTDCLRCPAGSFLFWNGTCINSCVPPLVTTTEGNFKSCELPCLAGEFYNWNDICQSDCVFPYKELIYGDLKICASPCSSTDFYYWNNTCYAECELPLIPSAEDGYTACTLPCIAPEYVYLDDTCHLTCDSPFTEILQGDLKICGSICDDNEYLYWNGTCHSTCPVAYREVLGYGKKYCSEHCPIEKYLYWNSSCFYTCEAPLISTIDSELLQYCNLPCNSNEFLYQNSSCIETCKTPFIVELIMNNELPLCNSPCLDTEYFDSAKSTCVSTCDPPSIIEQSGVLKICWFVYPPKPPSSLTPVEVLSEVIGQGTISIGIANNFIKPNSLNSLFMIALTNLITYIQYIDVSYPEKVIELFDSELFGIFTVDLDFGYNTSQVFQDQIRKIPLPDVFERRDLHSSFLINHWNKLALCVLCIILGIILWPIEWFVSMCKIQPLLIFIKKLSTAARWNIFLVAFFSSYDELTLAAVIELRTHAASSAMEILSFSICVLMITFALYLLWKVFEIYRENKKDKIHPVNAKTKSQREKRLQRMQTYRVLYEDFNHDNFLKHSFLFFFTLRIILCYLIVTLMFNYPFTQIVLLTLFSPIMLFYITRIKPLKDKLDYIENVSFEIIILIVNVCVLVLAVMDKVESTSENGRKILGEIIIIMNLLTGIGAVVFSVVSVVCSIRELYNQSKDIQKKEEIENKPHIKVEEKHKDNFLDSDENNSPIKRLKTHRKAWQDKERARNSQNFISSDEEVEIIQCDQKMEKDPGSISPIKKEVDSLTAIKGRTSLYKESSSSFKDSIISPTNSTIQLMFDEPVSSGGMSRAAYLKLLTNRLRNEIDRRSNNSRIKTNSFNLSDNSSQGSFNDKASIESRKSSFLAIESFLPNGTNRNEEKELVDKKERLSVPSASSFLRRKQILHKIKDDTE